VDTEGTTCDLCRHDIAIVAIGRRHKSIRLFKSGTPKHILISPVAYYSLALWKVTAKAAESVAILVYDCNPMSLAGK